MTTTDHEHRPSATYTTTPYPSSVLWTQAEIDRCYAGYPAAGFRAQGRRKWAEIGKCECGVLIGRFETNRPERPGADLSWHLAEPTGSQYFQQPVYRVSEPDNPVHG